MNTTAGILQPPLRPQLPTTNEVGAYAVGLVVAVILLNYTITRGLDWLVSVIEEAVYPKHTKNTKRYTKD